MSLDATHHDYFHRVMRGCRNLSHSKPEVDGLDDLLGTTEQQAFDLAFMREGRREKQGYVTPAEARAFLQMSRELRLGPGTTPPDSPVSRAYFRALNTAPSPLPAAPDSPPTPDSTPGDIADTADIAAIAAVVDVLQEAGVLPPQPRALLEGPRGDRPPRLARIQRHMQFVHDADPIAYSTRSEELAYLANTIVAGCPSRRGRLMRRKPRMPRLPCATLASRTGRLTGSLGYRTIFSSVAIDPVFD